MRQVEGSDIPEGGWVGGDAWFGSITAAVKVYKKIKFHSTWIIKNNKFVFPMEFICEIIKARHKKTMEHWVVVITEISDVLIFACPHAWSQYSISYFLSTTINNNPSLQLYISQFEDGFGCVGWRDIPRPNFSNL